MDIFIQNLQPFILFCRELIHFEELSKCDISEGTQVLFRLNNTIIEHTIHMQRYLEMWVFRLKQQQKNAYGQAQRKYTLQIQRLEIMILDLEYVLEKLRSGMLLGTLKN